MERQVLLILRHDLLITEADLVAYALPVLNQYVSQTPLIPDSPATTTSPPLTPRPRPVALPTLRRMSASPSEAPTRFTCESPQCLNVVLQLEYHRNSFLAPIAADKDTHQ